MTYIKFCRKKTIIQYAITLLFLLSSMVFNVQSHADTPSNTQIGRYTTVINKPTSSQVNLLSQVIQVHFPQNIITINDAVTYILHLSGYSLVDDNKMNAALKITLTKPLPLVDRNFGPMSLADALNTLAGPAFNLEHDPITRTINFSLKKEYLKSFSKSHHKKFLDSQNISHI
jgi:conjugative transfer region protein (TIGR03748 family)